jgi:biopolymer transport protein ExbD
LPEVADGKTLALPSKNREVAVFADGRVTLDNTTVTLVELTAQLAESQKARPDQSVVILGDAGCPFQHVAAALAACKEAGVSDLAVSVRVAQSSSAKSPARGRR